MTKYVLYFAILWFSPTLAQDMKQNRNVINNEYKQKLLAEYDSIDRIETDVFRKYNFEGFWGVAAPWNISKSSHLIDYTFGILEFKMGKKIFIDSNLLNIIDKRFELNAGIGSAGFQGNEISVGFNYLAGRENETVIFEFGTDCKLGFGSQLSDNLGDYSIIIGYQKYVIPFIGLKINPWRDRNLEDISSLVGKINRYKTRLSVNIQLGYSFLIGKQQVDTIGNVPKIEYIYAKSAILHQYSFKIGVIWDIPSNGKFQQYNSPDSDDKGVE